METVVLIAATVLIGIGQTLVVVTTRPRPRSSLEVLWLVLPVLGVVALVVGTWRVDG